MLSYLYLYAIKIHAVEVAFPNLDYILDEIESVHKVWKPWVLENLFMPTKILYFRCLIKVSIQENVFSFQLYFQNHTMKDSLPRHAVNICIIQSYYRDSFNLLF